MRMKLQFTWDGCDSALAAPLLLDLARLAAARARRGTHRSAGLVAFFFKDPMGTDEHRLGEQFANLVSWAETL